MRREERKKRGGEKAKRKSQDCCDTFKPTSKFCFLCLLAELRKLIQWFVGALLMDTLVSGQIYLSGHLHETLVACKGIQDSPGFWIPRHVFWIPGTEFRSFFSEILELYSGFQIPGFQIPQAQISPVPESGFPYVGLKTRFC